MRLHCRIKFILRKIKHFWEWAPIIWNDEDWDACYLYEIMRFKIAKLRVDMVESDRHNTVKRNVKQMKIAEELLARHAFSEFYHENRFNNDHQGLCTCNNDILFKDCFKKTDNPHLLEWVNPFCSWCKNRTIIKNGHAKEDADFVILWDIMCKHSRRWWN